MNKPELKDSFSVEDIHELREWHYERTKHLSDDKIIKDISEKAKKFKEELEREKEKYSKRSKKI